MTSKSLAADVRGRLVALGGITQLARICLTRLGTNQGDLTAGFTQAIDGIPHFHFLILLLDEHRRTHVLQVHLCILR